MRAAHIWLGEDRFFVAYRRPWRPADIHAMTSGVPARNGAASVGDSANAVRIMVKVRSPSEIA
jgi:hypothetical protein